MLRISELAGAAGVGIQTVRFYERRGLLPRPARSPGGHRLYDERDVHRIRGIKAAQRSGFTLAEIARSLRHRPGAEPALREPARRKLVEVESEITRLRDVARTLRLVADAGCDDLDVCAAIPDCPLMETV